MIDLRDQIRQRMDAQDMTGVALAGLLGTTSAYLSRLMTRDKPLPSQWQDKILQQLGGTAEATVEWNDDDQTHRVQCSGHGGHRTG